MKKIATLSGLLALWSAAVFSAELPRKAPELTIAMPDGAPVKLSDYRGKVVVFAFILTT